MSKEQERRKQLSEETLAQVDRVELGVPATVRGDFVLEGEADAQVDRSMRYFAYSREGVARASQARDAGASGGGR